YLNGEVLASGHSRVFRISFHLREVAKIIEALLGGLDAHAVQNIPGRDQHFPADHFVFRARVADDVDALDKGGLAFFDRIGDIDFSRPTRNALRRYSQVDIAAAAISIRELLGIIADLFWGINHIFLTAIKAEKRLS